MGHDDFVRIHRFKASHGEDLKKERVTTALIIVRLAPLLINLELHAMSPRSLCLVNAENMLCS